MLTPVFSISQTVEDVVVVIRAPMSRLAETEVTVEDNELYFHSRPYFLRLQLPGSVESDADPNPTKVSFDSGTFTVTLKKSTPGEHFPDLNMITQLLTATSSTSTNQVRAPLIEVLSSQSEATGVDDACDVTSIDWLLERSIPEEFVRSNELLSEYRYGFALTRSSMFTEKSELNLVLDLPDPEHTPLEERERMREAAEEKAFSGDHYLADLYEPELTNQTLAYTPVWVEEWRRMRNGEQIDSLVEYTEDELLLLKNLPKKEYLISSDLLPMVYLGLVDLLLSYAYTVRLWEGEDNVESGWTITKMAATLSWFQVHRSLPSTVKCFCRRALVYPLCRSWKLCCKVRKDVVYILALGKPRILKCLLHMRRLLNEYEGHYIFNELYITDYLVWIQSASNDLIKELMESLQSLKISKEDMSLELPEWELAGQLALEEATLQATRDVTID